MILGVDYASVDGNQVPDFPKAHQAGIRFAVIRATWGTYVDPDLARDAAAARAAGLTVGAYMFLRFPELGHPAPSVADQVAAFARAYHKEAGDLPPTLDVEFPGRGITDTGLTAPEALAMIVDAVTRLEGLYGTVMVYTSARVWEEDLHNLPSGKLFDCPLWVKTPYVYRARQPLLLGTTSADVTAGLVPPPWHGAAWIQQFQGDATGAPGFTGTVDADRFITATGDNTDPRAHWIHSRLGGRTVAQFQDAHALKPDGVIGPVTFAALCDV